MHVAKPNLLADARVACIRVLNSHATALDKRGTILLPDATRGAALWVALQALNVLDDPRRDSRCTRLVTNLGKRLRGTKYVAATNATRWAAKQVQQGESGLEVATELANTLAIDGLTVRLSVEEIVPLLCSYTTGRAKRGGTKRTAHGILAKIIGVNVKTIGKAIDRASD